MYRVFPREAILFRAAASSRLLNDSVAAAINMRATETSIIV